jgi:hypothetical protein
MKCLNNVPFTLEITGDKATLDRSGKTGDCDCSIGDGIEGEYDSAKNTATFDGGNFKIVLSNIDPTHVSYEQTVSGMDGDCSAKTEVVKGSCLGAMTAGALAGIIIGVIAAVVIVALVVIFFLCPSWIPCLGSKKPAAGA